MANSNIDFLRFSAYSMKELITRKLSEDSKFTDQVYEGSNLAILIDIISYMYQCLAYQLNSAAAESMFADTQLYDNMVRLVQFIGYNPRGCFPATLVANIKAFGDELTVRGHHLPHFTYFQTNVTGADGGQVCFSTAERYQLESDSMSNGLSVDFYNGKWQLYDTVFTASGTSHETFTLEGLKSDSANKKYVSGDFIRVVVGSLRDEGGMAYSDGKYRYSDIGDWINDSNGIFTRSTREALDLRSNENFSTNFYDASDKIYTVCLDENKQYELRFGDGITGKKLWPGDRVYVFYLKSDGPSGEIDIGTIDFSKLKLRHDYQAFSAPDELKEIIFGEEDKLGRIFGPSDDSDHIQVSIQAQSTVPTEFKPEEDVYDIRSNAPGWFKTGNRLITARDIEYYIRAYGNTLGIGSGIVDVKCMNNLRYVATFYKWLYENGIKSQNEPDRARERETGVDPGKYYLDNVTFNRANFKYIDPADANNTYLWIKTESAMQDEQVIKSQSTINDRLYHLKTITTEFQLVKPVLVKFAICANPDLDDIKARYFNEQDLYFDSKCESYVEITLDDNAIYVSSNIQKLVYDQIIKAFDVNQMRLGGIVKFNDIVDGIYSINGVQRVRTIYFPENGYSRACDGVSFASWSEESVLHFHEDLEVGNIMRHVEEFQFPVLEGEDLLMDRIKVITKSMQQIHTLKF